MVEAHTAASTIMLELPPELVSRQVHPMFHVSLIWVHMANDDEQFPHCDMQSYYDFSPTNKHEWFIYEILAPDG